MTNRDAIDALYREAVGIADAARLWFDGPGLTWRATLPVDEQAVVAVHSLSTTARLLAGMSWLLQPGHLAGTALRALTIPVGEPPSPLLATTPGGEIVEASRRLVERLAALAPTPAPAPAPVTSHGGLWRI